MIVWKKIEDGFNNFVDVAFVADCRIGSVVKTADVAVFQCNTETDKTYQANYFLAEELKITHSADTIEECMQAVEARFNEWLDKAGLTFTK